MKIWTYVVIAATAFSVLGCNVDATLEKLGGIKSFDLAKATGLISGSSQTGKSTDNAYYVQSSVGSYISGNGEQSATDPSNPAGDKYIVYSSVQGALISN